MNKSRRASPFGVRCLRHICFLAIALHRVGAFADSFTDRVTAAFNQKDPKLQATAKADDEIHLTTPIGGDVALPARDWLLAARLDNPQAIAKLRTVAARIAAGEPTAVTSALVRRNGQSWIEVPP
jgi:hypothetical protein